MSCENRTVEAQSMTGEREVFAKNSWRPTRVFSTSIFLTTKLPLDTLVCARSRALGHDLIYAVQENRCCDEVHQAMVR